jgi:hypothetical protein
MAPDPQDEQHIPDIKRAFEVMKEITGETFKTIDALAVVLAITADIYAAIHGDEAAEDFLKRVIKFTAKYSLVPASYTEADRQKGVELSRQVEQAWKAMEPQVSTRAIEIMLYMAANYSWQAIYGDQCVRDWQGLIKEWAVRWGGVPVASEVAN